MLCPRCQVDLKQDLKDGVEVDHCETCKGIWVEHADEKHVLEVKPETFSMDELRMLRKKYEPLGKREKASYIPCPICQQLMQRRNWGSHSGVIVDKCGDHGTWYDDGEVEKIREYVALGGIEFEKMRASEKGDRRLEQRLMNEVSRLDKKADSVYMRARLWSMIGF